MPDDGTRDAMAETDRAGFDGPVQHLDRLAPGKALVMLDFDGTLVDLAETPDGIHVPAALAPLLARLADRCAGVAVVSGRTVAELRHYLGDPDLRLYGCHGGESWEGGTYALAPGLAADDVDRIHAEEVKC